MGRFFLLAGISLLAACTHVQPVEEKLPPGDSAGYPALGAPLPDTGAPATAPGTWYETALPADLEALLATAAMQSPDLRIEAQRVVQAEAALQAAEANRWIDVLLTGNVGTRYNTDSGDTTDSGQAGLSLDMPLDVSGRLRTLRNAARYDLAAAEANYDFTRNTTLRDLAISAVDAAEAARLQRLIEAQIETSETLLNLTELRFAQGQASIVDVLQQRDQIASLEQQLPPLRATRTAALDTIATATGVPPTAENAAAFADIPLIAAPQAFPAADRLVETRPDLRRSVSNLQSSNAIYTAALLNRLPSFSLSSTAAHDLVTGDAAGFVSATLSGALTVFDSGSKSAAIKRSGAQYEEFGTVLLRDWLAALAEIDTLIAQEREGLESIRLTEERLETANQLLDSARRRYRQGASDYLPVLNALSSIQSQEQRLIGLRASQARLRIRLHAALGLPPTAEADRPTQSDLTERTI